MVKKSSRSAFLFLHPTPPLQTVYKMEKPDIAESPRKRQKTDDAGSIAIAAGGDGAADAPTSTAVFDAQALKEVEVGITEFVSNDTEGFFGVLKKR
jgi:tRNA pseudouridine13 synthase